MKSQKDHIVHQTYIDMFLKLNKYKYKNISLEEKILFVSYNPEIARAYNLFMAKQINLLFSNAYCRDNICYKVALKELKKAVIIKFKKALIAIRNNRHILIEKSFKDIYDYTYKKELFADLIRTVKIKKSNSSTLQLDIYDTAKRGSRVATYNFIKNTFHWGDLDDYVTKKLGYNLFENPDNIFNEEHYNKEFDNFCIFIAKIEKEYFTF